MLSFQTQQRPIVQPIYKPTEPTVIIQRVFVGGPVVVLTPSVDNNNPNADDDITLTIIYNNNDTKAIKNVVLKVILPSETSYINSNLPPTSISGNNLSFNLGTVSANTQGVITVRIHINKSISSNSSLMFNLSLEYTNSSNQFQSVSAFLNVTVNKGSSLAASLLDFIGALFGNWFFDLLLGLVLGFGIYHFFIRSKETDVAV